MSNKGIGVGICEKHGEYYLDAPDSPCPSCEDDIPLDENFDDHVECNNCGYKGLVRLCSDTCPQCKKVGTLKEYETTDWVEKHSVNCYFCGILFDEREGQDADKYNNNDGGSICHSCIILKGNGENK